MTWLQGPNGAGDLSGVLALRPSLAEKFSAFTDAFSQDDSVPKPILDACLERVRWVHGLVPRVDDDWSPAETTALKVAELMPYGHHDISDADVTDLVEHFSEAGAVTLLTSIAMFDATVRMEILLGQTAEGAQ